MAFETKRNDVTAFIQGAWVEIMGGQFRIARAGNPDYEKALEASGYRKKEEPEEKMAALYQAICTGILKDWKDVTANGEPLSYSVENGVQVLIENPDLSGRILAEANDLENYRKQDVVKQAKKPANT